MNKIKILWQSDSVFLPTGYCYSEDTEILTKEGWKLFQDISENEIVATRNDKEELEYHKINEKIVQDYNGPMIEWKGQQYDIKVTPNHRMLVQRPLWFNKKEKPKLIKSAQELFEAKTKFKAYSFIKDCIWKGKEEKEFVINQYERNLKLRKKVLPMDEFLKFLGWHMSEGWVTKIKNGNYRIFISQSKKTNPEKCKEIEKTLKKLGFHYNYDRDSYIILSKGLFEVLEQFGKSHEKFVPDFIKNLSSRQIKIFLTTLFKGDGTIVIKKGKEQFATLTSSSGKLIDDLHELLIKIGLNGRVRKNVKKSSYGLNSDKSCHVISVNHYRLRPHVSNKPTKTSYNGKIYCVNVKNNIIMVRRNGTAMWCGNSRVTRELLTRLSKDPEFEVVAVATNALQGMSIKNATLEDETILDFLILPQGKHPYNADIMIPYISRYQPHIFCTLQDTFMHFPAMTKLDFPCKTLFYFPSDGEPFPLGCEAVLKKMTVSVAMAKFGQEQVKKQFDIDSEYIPHGVNTNEFFPIIDKTKEQLRSERNVLVVDSNNNLIWYKDFLKNKFVVFSAFRNQGRKMPDRQLKSWAEFAKGKEDVVMLCHCDATDNAAVFDIRKLINDLKINNSVCFTGMQFHTPFTQEELNQVYNMGNVYMQSSSGEGFGLITVESMSCELPIIITDCTCYSNDTRVLTENGLKYFNELKEGEKVWSKNLSNQLMELKPITKIISKKWNKDMIKIKNRDIDLLVTPDHNMVVRQSLNYNKWSDWKIVEASELLNRSHWKFPVKADWDGSTHSKYLELPTIEKTTNTTILGKIKIEDYLELVGWYIAEGWQRKDKTKENNIIGLSVPLSDKYRKEVENLIERIGLKYTKGNPDIVFYSKELCKQLEECGCGALNKKIPKWVLKLDKTYLKIVFDSMNKGDGCKLKSDKFRLYTTISEQLSTDLIELCLKLGYSAKIKFWDSDTKPSYTKKYNRFIYPRHKTYRIYIRTESLEGHVLTKKSIRKQEYNDTVWCISVKDNHNLLVERNGNFVFCGNTTKELVTENNCGIAVPTCCEITGTYNVSRFLMDIEKGTEALQFYYDDWKSNESKVIKKHGSNGRKACKEKYEWDNIATQWKELFKRMMS